MGELIFAQPVDAVAAELGHPGRRVILDAGCGSETFGARLARNPNLVIGLDIDHSALERARELAEASGLSGRLFLVRASSESIPLRSESVDGVLSKSTMQYVDRPEVFAECHRVLRDDGALVLVENLPHNPFVALARVGRWMASRIGGDTSYIDSIRGYVTLEDLETLEASFELSWRRAFHVTRAATLLLLARSPGSRRLLTLDAHLARLDDRLLERFPSVERIAWVVAFAGRKPKVEARKGQDE